MKLLKVEEIKANHILEVKYETDEGEEKMFISNDLDLKNDFEKICDVIRKQESVQTVLDDRKERKLVREEVSSLSNKSFSLKKQETK